MHFACIIIYIIIINFSYAKFYYLKNFVESVGSCHISSRLLYVLHVYLLAIIYNTTIHELSQLSYILHVNNSREKN